MRIRYPLLALLCLVAASCETTTGIDPDPMGAEVIPIQVSGSPVGIDDAGAVLLRQGARHLVWDLESRTTSELSFARDSIYIEDFNNRGVLIGYEVEERRHIVRWTPERRLERLATPGGHDWDYRRVAAVNDAGEVVGYAGDHGAAGIAIRWRSDGTPVALPRGVPDTSVSLVPEAIGRNGLVAGTLWGWWPRSVPLILWTDEGMELAGSPDGHPYVSVVGVTADGRVVVEAHDRGPDGPEHPAIGTFMYDGTRFERIPIHVHAVNDRGDIAGCVEPPAGQPCEDVLLITHDGEVLLQSIRGRFPAADWLDLHVIDLNERRDVLIRVLDDPGPYFGNPSPAHLFVLRQE